MVIVSGLAEFGTAVYRSANFRTKFEVCKLSVPDL